LLIENYIIMYWFLFKSSYLI